MSKIDEQRISGFIADQLRINLNGTKFRLDGWGEVDNWTQLDNGVFIFLEVETSQKHQSASLKKRLLENRKVIDNFNSVL